jgi:transposase
MNDLTQKYTCWGVDVASGHLDIAAHGIQAVKRIANTPAAIKQWLRSMPAGSKVGLESTGIYHLELARLAHQHGLVVYVLNPRDIKKYSQGMLRLFDRAKGASADAIVALIGLDPRPMESGNRKGIRRLSKRGDSETRRLLYNAGMAGAKTDTWRPVFERERAKGLPATAALMVLARRLVRIAYSLFKSGGQFDRQRVAS